MGDSLKIKITATASVSALNIHRVQRERGKASSEIYSFLGKKTQFLMKTSS